MIADLHAHYPMHVRPRRPTLGEHTIERIAARGGLIGLILAEHQAADGLRRAGTLSFQDSFAVLAHHIDRIREITGSHRHTAIGSDFDGFVKPTLAGLADMRSLGRLEARLGAHYGEAGELIASGNVLGLLRSAWGKDCRAEGAPDLAGD